MVLYFDSALESPSGAATTCLSWHEQHGMISIGFSLAEGKGGVVNSYNKEGLPIHTVPVLQRSVPPTAILWHPTRKLLVVGWENGDVVIWNDDSEEVHDVPQLHTTPITALTWTSSGSRLGTADKEGVFASWKVDVRGRVQHDPIYRHAFLSPITDCVCKPGNVGSGEPDFSNIASLARAAVSGDETALDMFADYKKGFGPKLKLPLKRKEGLAFYVGLADGAVHHINEKGVKSESFRLDSSIQQLLYCQDKDFLVAVSADLQVVKCRVHGDGKVEELDRVKFSGVEGSARIVWAGSALLAVATSDPSLRLWDLNSGDNYALVLKMSHGFTDKECVANVAYCPVKRILAAATDNGKIAIWKSTLQQHDKLDPEDRWHLQPSIHLGLPCPMIQWCHSFPILVAGGPGGASLLTEQKSKCALSFTMVAVQTGPRRVVVDIIGQKASQTPTLSGMAMQHAATSTTDAHVEFDTDNPFRGLAASMENLAVWDGHTVSVYEVTSSGERLIGSFPCISSVIGLHDQSVFSVEAPKDAKDKPKIQVRNFQGTVKQLLHLQDNEGFPHLISTADNYMVMATDAGYIRVYDLSRRDAKPHCNSKNLHEVIPELGVITSVVVNPNGSKVAVLCNKDSGVPDTKLYVYDVEADKLENFDFHTGTNDLDDFADSGPKTDAEQSRDDVATDVAGRYPVTVRWDATENRLLSCEAQINDNARKSANELSEHRKSSLSLVEGTPDSSAPSAVEMLVVSLFVTQDHGVMLQDSFEWSPTHDQLIGMKVPYFYFSKLLSSASNNTTTSDAPSLDEKVSVTRKTMRDFVGLDDCDETAQAAMLNFSYYLTIGDMDEAFKAIKLIKGVAVWESMARMCVKTRRLDVAKVCLANMGHARGARALRESEKEPERDARVARLAVELGMNEEAEKLYRSCERYDLLNLFYQATGQWEKALETAGQADRVHLRMTYYKYAKHLEAAGDIAGAIPNYEKSGNHYFEVPRMLFDETQMLEAYIMKSKDRKLRKWWAQYMESTGEMETALKFYKQAADPLSLVRVYCYCGNPEKAAEVANETGDRAACYHLARQFENGDDVKQAIHFFTRARAFGNAIRICKEHGFEDQLMNLALLSSPADMVEAARYYEDRPDAVDKAVMLYHKAGHFSEALELAFESEQFAALELISQELDDRTDPILLERCADFFTEHQQHDRAVAMLVAAKRYEEAISVCDSHDVRMTETLVERLTIPKNFMDKNKRDGLLIKLGDCCVKQGEYHLACQKYTQAGDKEKAMRALLKSGDTEKIVFFAGVSRTKNVYVMAANYLQSLDWRKDPEIMKNIISFYTKGRALASLAGFYDACAQVEIDEYQNYEKALGAMSEAFKCLAKAKMADKQQQENKISDLKARIALVKKFLQTRRLFESDPEEGIKLCHSLLAEHDLDTSVRYGDVYGLLVEYHAGQEDFDKAYRLMQELRERMPSVVMSYFVNVATIETVHRAVGAPLGRGVGLENLANGDGHKVEESDDEVQEEIFDGGFGF